MKRCVKSILSLFITIIVLLSLAGCCSEEQKVVTEPSYIKEIDEWHKKRVQSLTSENGWLSLAGLFWLKEGENSFGSDPMNDIVFPKDKAPDLMGTFVLEKGKVEITIKPGVTILHDKTPVGRIILQNDQKDEPTVLTYGSLSWYVIKRDDRYGIRLKDKENPRIKEFKGIERFPVLAEWKIKATYVPYDPPKKIAVPTVLGTTSEESSPGALKFRIQGNTYQLDALGNAGDEEYFIIFGDKTNGFETYGGGRFLSVKKPDEKGSAYIDFNKAYNPPCAFSEFATCPLPPPQNKIPVRITAGEKRYAGSNH